MSIIVRWDDDARNIGRLDFHGRWTLEDLAIAEAQVQAMKQEADQIGLLIDLRDGSALPDRIVDYAEQVAGMHSNKLDGIIFFAVVGSSPLGEALFKSFCKVCRPNRLMDKLKFVDTVDEARTVLAKYMPSRT